MVRAAMEVDLAERFEAFTNPDSPEYDADFTPQIKALAPVWFK